MEGVNNSVVMSEHLEYLGSEEFQAAYTIFEKYKRSMDLDISNLRKLDCASYIISRRREEVGKNASLGFLLQEVGKYLKGDCKDQEHLENAVNSLERYRTN